MSNESTRELLCAVKKNLEMGEVVSNEEQISAFDLIKRIGGNLAFLNDKFFMQYDNASISLKSRSVVETGAKLEFELEYKKFLKKNMRFFITRQSNGNIFIGKPEHNMLSRQGFINRIVEIIRKYKDEKIDSILEYISILEEFSKRTNSIIHDGRIYSFSQDGFKDAEQYCTFTVGNLVFEFDINDINNVSLRYVSDSTIHPVSEEEMKKLSIEENMESMLRRVPIQISELNPLYKIALGYDAKEKNAVIQKSGE